MRYRNSYGSNNRPSKKDIKITEHAKLRIGERAPHIPRSEYKQWVYNARYKGIPFDAMPPELQRWVRTSLHLGPKMIGARVYQNYLFLFRGNSGKAKTLVTMYPIPEAMIPYAEQSAK